MKRKNSTVLLMILYLSIFCFSVHAQSTSPSAITTPAPTEENIANCDMCGFCQGQVEVPTNWATCRNCLYPEATSFPAESNKTLIGLPQPDVNHYYTMLGCLSTNPGEFSLQITKFFFSIIGGIAFLSFLYGSVIIATSQANAERLNYGKRVVYASIAGLLFVIFSTFLIRLIAVDIFKIPAFGG